MTFPLLPRAASETAVQVDRLGWGLLSLSALVLILVLLPLDHLRSTTAARSPTTWTVTSTKDTKTPAAASNTMTMPTTDAAQIRVRRPGMPAA